MLQCHLQYLAVDILQESSRHVACLPTDSKVVTRLHSDRPGSESPYCYPLALSQLFVVAVPFSCPLPPRKAQVPRFLSPVEVCSTELKCSKPNRKAF